jgi:hypothetical protein
MRRRLRLGDIPRRLDQRRQRPQRLAQLKERMLKRPARIRSLLRVHLERLRQIVPERPAQRFRVRDRRRPVRRDEVKRLERVLVQVRRLALDHLDRHDAERPDVDLGPVLLAGDDFGRHPVRGTDHGGALGVALGDLGTEAKVGCGEG